MGVNATTSVPVYADGEILDASRLNVTNSGVPVFATTTTRDAAFGGTGEKVLAEGQMAYIENIAGSSAVQYYDGSAWQTVGGLAVVKAETAFTTASSITADGVFTSAYTNYKIMVRFTSTTASSILIRLRTGGTSASGTNYNHQYLTGFSSSTGAARTSNSNTAIASYGTNGNFFSMFETTIFGPALAEATTYQSYANTSDGAYTAPYVNLWSGNHTLATSYDGIEIFPGSGTMTGTYTIYGLAK